MAITFHCEYCGKKIEAPDSAGGKWGKCPACHHKLYIPGLDSGEELELAPIDKNDQAKQKELMDETHKLTHDILLEKDETNSSAGSTMRISEMSDKELTKNVITYLWYMANGELDQAEITVDLIVPYGSRAVKILDEIAVSEIPEPELADIPQQVLAGLIRNLRARIS